VQAVGIQINVRDFPEHGLTIISPSDPSFNDKASSLFNGKQSAFSESLKPFSVLLTNTSDKSIVAYILKWEMVRADGTVFTRETGGANPAALMDGGTAGYEYLSTTAGVAVKPNGIRYISSIIPLSEDQGGRITSYAGGSSDKNALPDLQQAVQTRNYEGLLNSVIAEMQSCISMTVSIDGAFFEDGTFVGPDSTNLFARVQGNVDAKRDLLQEVAFALKHNRSSKEVFNDIEEIVKTPDIGIAPFSTPEVYYNYYKRQYADEILHMRKVLGEEKAIAISLQPLRKQWPKLKKL
jgi:hypothetical protein